MATVSECPTAESLQQLLLGLGDPTHAAEWERHLTDCPRCAELASHLQAEDDLVRTVRRSAIADDTPEPDVVATLVSVFSRLPATGSAATAHWAGSQPSALATKGFLAAPHQTDELGRLGPYVIHEILGSGGMGVVYRGFDPRLQRAVAVKVIRTELLTTAGMAERFLGEARAAAAVEHDHIVVVHAVEEHDGVHCLTMPLLQGETLEQRMRGTPGPLPLADVLRIGREMAAGLAAAHAKGLIHRDIKPGNLWLEKPAGRIKILDFGLALALGAAGQAAGFAGTPGYMAPEQARGKPVDARTDLFSVGCVLYRMATGSSPFEADTPIGMIVRTVTDAPRPAVEANPAMNPNLAQLIDRLLAKNPDERPESAEAVLAELAAIVAEHTARQVRTTRRRWMIGVAAAAVVGGVGAWAAFWAKTPTPEPPVKVTIVADPDVGKLILTRDGKDHLVDPTSDNAVSLAPGDYNVRPATAVPGREPVPSTFVVLPKEPLTIRVALVGEVAQMKSHSGPVMGVAVFTRKDRLTVLSASKDRTLNTWTPGVNETRLFENLTSPGNCLAATPDGSLIATAGGNRQIPFELDIHLFDGNAFRRLDKALSGHSRLISAVAMSPNGKQVISAARSDLRLWDVTAATFRELSEHGADAQVMAAAFSPDGKHALTGDDDGFLVLWDVAEAKALRKVIGGGTPSEVRAVAFAPTGFVTGSADGIIRIWDRETFKARELPAVPKAIRTLAMSKDGKRLLAGSEDGVVRLWSLPEGVVIREFAGHKASVNSVAFTPDERSAVSGSDDHSVRLWRLPY